MARSRGREDSAGGGWADFADGFGFSVCHMVLRVVSVTYCVKKIDGRGLP
jgi:hypothetical protein